MNHRAASSCLLVLTLVGSACGTQASSGSRNATGTSVAVSNIPEIALSRFPPPVHAALVSLSSRMRVPMIAPLTIPANLSAKLTIAKSGYAVSLYRCESRFPLNSPEIGNPPNCSGLAPYFGAFGVTRYPTAAAAHVWLSISQKQRTTFCGPNTNSPQRVSLVRGIEGVLIGTKRISGYCEMHFELNGWNVVVGGNATLYSIAEARQEGLRVVDIMSKVRMPANSGNIVIQTAGDGNHTWLSWTIGQSLYTVSGYHSSSAAFAMAGSMAFVANVPAG